LNEFAPPGQLKRSAAHGQTTLTVWLPLKSALNLSKENGSAWRKSRGLVLVDS
jgi:hypothetical protein